MPGRPETEKAFLAQRQQERDEDHARKVKGALAMLAEGFLPSEVAERYGISKHTLVDWRKKAARVVA
jgi:hypothetical protein